MRTNSPRSSGFTLVEVIVVIGILTTVLWLVGNSFMSGKRAFRTSAAIMEIDADGSRTMRRITEALRGSEEDSISSIPQVPFCSGSADFQVMEPYDGTVTPLGPPRNISLDAQGSVLWVENPGLASERRTRWSNDVAPLLEGETLNGLDDNGNGLIDEPGLFFSRDGEVVLVGLTITSQSPNGPLTRTWTTRIHCRN